MESFNRSVGSGKKFGFRLLAYVDNIELCSKMAEKIAVKNEFFWGMLRLFCSYDGVNNFNCAPNGMLAIQKNAIFSFYVMNFGMEKAKLMFESIEECSLKLMKLSYFELLLLLAFLSLKIDIDFGDEEKTIEPIKAVVNLGCSTLKSIIEEEGVEDLTKMLLTFIDWVNELKVNLAFFPMVINCSSDLN